MDPWWRMEAMGRTILLHFSKESLAIFPEILASWQKPMTKTLESVASISGTNLLKILEEKSKAVEEISPPCVVST
jgi:hypothetical protein